MIKLAGFGGIGQPTRMKKSFTFTLSITVQ